MCKDKRALVGRLRVAVQRLRRTPMAIADVVPLLQEAADALAGALEEFDALTPTPHKVFDALQVLRLTPHIREYLRANDEQALAQADAAVAAEPLTLEAVSEPQIFVRFETGSENRFSQKDYGPYEWIQLTYDVLRVQTLGDAEPCELAVYTSDGRWEDDNGKLWSDVVIYPAEKIPSTAENWENGRLGRDERFARVASPEEEARVEAALGVQPLRTVAYICTSEAQAKAVVAHVVGQSQWFEFTPLPDGYYEVRVKFDAQWCLPK